LLFTALISMEKLADRLTGAAGATLPPIPVKRYFTIGEVGELCGVKPHVLRYWEQEFTQLRPMKRRGNRRYYQHHEVLMIRRIRDLLYDQGFTISGARNKLQELAQLDRVRRKTGDMQHDDLPGDAGMAADDVDAFNGCGTASPSTGPVPHTGTNAALPTTATYPLAQLRRELLEIQELLSASY
jgi:DNA-binding transcriptional MerR regulator